jgi:hypothetical protein
MVWKLRPSTVIRESLCHAPHIASERVKTTFCCNRKYICERTVHSNQELNFKENIYYVSWIISFTPRPLCTQAKVPRRYTLYRNWVEPRVCQDYAEKRKNFPLPEIEPWPSSPSLYIPTDTSRLFYFTSELFKKLSSDFFLRVFSILLHV